MRTESDNQYQMILPASLSRKWMKRIRLRYLTFSIIFLIGYVPIANAFVVNSRKGGMRGRQSISTWSSYYRWTIMRTQDIASKERKEGRKISYLKRSNGDNNDDSNEFRYSEFNNGSYFKNNDDLADSIDDWQQKKDDDDKNSSTPFIVSQNPDRAISIVSELKANAALFAAFAYGSLNLPNTLTVSESKVTSVTTSLSISRPLPDSDLIRTFVVLDVCTLCLMISCVAASQLLIYRLTDGSYEDVDENYGNADNSQVNSIESYASRKRKNSRDSALGRLVTTYRNEFTVARITFDLGLVTLLLAVGVRSLAVFDEDIVVPVGIVIGITSVFLAVAYFTTYIEVFRTAENLTESQIFSLQLPLFKMTSTNGADDVENNPGENRNNPIIFRILLPISLISVAVGFYFTLSGGSEPGINLSRLGPYDVTSGATKLKVVTEKIDSEKGKSDAKGRNQQRSVNSPSRNSSFNIGKKVGRKADAEASKKKAVEAEAKKKAEEDAKKKAVEEEAKKKAEEDAKKKAEEEVKKKVEENSKRKSEEEARKKSEEDSKRKAEEEALKRLEKEARRRAEEQAAAATDAANARVEAALEAAKIKSQDEAASVVSAPTPGYI